VRLKKLAHSAVMEEMLFLQRIARHKEEIDHVTFQHQVSGRQCVCECVCVCVYVCMYLCMCVSLFASVWKRERRGDSVCVWSFICGSFLIFYYTVSGRSTATGFPVATLYECSLCTWP
jgi:hypothetical protein